MGCIEADRGGAPRRRRFLGAALKAATVAVLAATSCVQEVGEDPGGQAQQVTVVYGGLSVEVDLGELEPVDLGEGDGPSHVRLSAVVESAGLGVSLTDLEFDFLASDGFAPRDSPNCTADLVPVPGAALEDGYIHQRTRRLVWGEALGYPGCLGVQDTVQIVAFDAEP